MRWQLVFGLLVPGTLLAGTAADLARALHENSFDRTECYRVRDVSIIKEDLKIYLTDGHLIFSKPVSGRRIAAAFTADVDSGDGEVILLPPNRAERASLASYSGSPNLNEHFRAAMFIFTGAEYDAILSQFPKDPEWRSICWAARPAIPGFSARCLRILNLATSTRSSIPLRKSRS